VKGAGGSPRPKVHHEQGSDATRACRNLSTLVQNVNHGDVMLGILLAALLRINTNT